MRKTRCRRAIIGMSAALVLCGNVVRAEEAYTPFRFDWNGIPLGQATLNYEATDATYHATLDGQAYGLGSLFVKMVATATADGTLKAPDWLHPTRYVTNYTLRKKNKSSTLEWNSAGKITKELNLPVKENDQRPKIAEEDKAGAVDPLSGFWSLREMLKTGGRLAATGGKARVKVLDGKRMYALEATNLRPTVWRHSGNPMEATMLRVRRLAISGFEPDEKLALEAGQAAEFYLYFCAAEATSCKAYEPLGLEMPVLLGLMRAAKTATATAPVAPVSAQGI